MNALCLLIDGNVTFPEFVRYVIDSWYEGARLDRHWIPQSTLCQPCQYHYDFIGHYETLYEDADSVIERLNAEIDPQDIVVKKFPRTSYDDKMFAKSSTVMEEFYSSIPENHMDELYRLYAKDYELFGYSPLMFRWKGAEYRLQSEKNQ
jgi:Sulfotransferase family